MQILNVAARWYCFLQLYMLNNHLIFLRILILILLPWHGGSKGNDLCDHVFLHTLVSSLSALSRLLDTTERTRYVSFIPRGQADRTYIVALEIAPVLAPEIQYMSSMYKRDKTERTYRPYRLPKPRRLAKYGQYLSRRSIQPNRLQSHLPVPNRQ